MNKHCICPGPGMCKRHGIIKDQRQYEYCKGIAQNADCGRKHWVAWERGKLGATAPEDPILDPDWECGGSTINNDQLAARAKSREPSATKQSPDGCKVGERLKKLIKEKYHLQASSTCKCNDRARQMDLMGCEGCEENFETIIEWLKDGVAERVWFRPIAMLVNTAAKVITGKDVEEQARAMLREAIDLEKAELKQRVNVVKQRAQPVPDEVPKKVKSWNYGVTTCLARIDTLLPRTLFSLAQGGFDDPWLFIDGLNPEDVEVLDRIVVNGRPLSNYNYTLRYPTLRTFGNWTLGLWELFIREPLCHRYALFQDDMVTYGNLRAYLDHCQFPDRGKQRGYWNLYTFPVNLDRANGKQGWFLSNQKGLGAVGLVFCRDCVMDLLSSRENIVERPTTPGRRSWSNIDGGIVTALKKLGWSEYVHNPSLVQHVGEVSSMGGSRHPQADSFKGTEFDAKQLIKGTK